MPSHTIIRPFATALLAACALAVAACGADEETDGGAASADDRQSQAREAALNHAKCMREHGVDMPDPQFDGGRTTQQGPAERVPEAKLREAEEACRKYFEELEPAEPPSEEEQQEFREAALAHARCMREHGIENFPDPTFDEDGGAQVRIDESMGLNPESAKFKEAEEACQDEMPEPEEQSP